MKIFSADQIRSLDAYTIENRPIPSIQLMENASMVFTDWMLENFFLEQQPVLIFVGPGNNGGDGLAVARMLHEKGIQVTIYLCHIGNKLSEDCATNLKRLSVVLKAQEEERLMGLDQGDELPEIPDSVLVIDAIFGSGLNRPVEGYWATVIEHINQSGSVVLAIDIPSGLFADQPTTGACIHATHTLSFELPKLAFFFPENYENVGEWHTRSIGLLYENFSEAQESDFHFLEKTLAASILSVRDKYSHKGVFGHALLLAGSYGKMGAAVLAARACLRSGVGLLTVHVPKCGYEIMQTAFPEAMVLADEQENYFSGINEDLGTYAATGLGCGWGLNAGTVIGMEEVLDRAQKPLVVDADGLNILAAHPELLEKLPEGSILTPHPGEFRRLFGTFGNDFERNAFQRRKAKEKKWVILLKGAHTTITCPDGKCYFNTTGNPGMATAGSGDALTGILLALLAQGYPPEQSAQLGVFIHGLAGDIAVREKGGQEALIATDIIEHLGKAFQTISEWKKLLS